MTQCFDLAAASSADSS